MFVRKIAHLSACAGTAAIGLSASAALSQTQAPIGQAKYAPIQNISYDFGSKSMSGYFVEQASQCLVMLMVSEKADPDAAPPATAARVRLVLSPGQMAGLDSEQGRSLNFTCGDGRDARSSSTSARRRSFSTFKGSPCERPSSD